MFSKTLGAFSAKLLTKVLGLFPLGLLYAAAGGLARLAFFFMPRRRRVAISNLGYAFGASLPEEEKKKIALKSFQHAAFTILELCLIPKFFRNPQRHFEFQGREHMEASLAAGHGAILAMSHLGSWELVSASPRFLRFQVLAVVKTIRAGFFDSMIQTWRDAAGYLATKKKNSIRASLETLKKNEAVAVLIDQWAGPEGIWVPFFEKGTATTSLPARLAKQTGASIVLHFAVRLEPGRFLIQLSPPLLPRKDDPFWETTVTSRLNTILEEMIRKYPDQWLWGHRRWKPKPSWVRETPGPKQYSV